MEGLLSVVTYLIIAVVVSTIFPFQCIIFLVTLPFDHQRYYSGRLFRLTSVISSRLSPLWRFSVVGKIPAKMPQRTVCVSNHLSLADSTLISYLPWEMKWLAKSSLFYIPVVGWSMALAGDISLKRGVRESAKEAMIKCRKWLDRGANVMIFPEGTRSRSGTMGDFKDGAFRLAIEAQCDVLPIAVAGTDDALKVHSWKMSRSKGVVSVGTPISTKGMTMDDLPDLRDRVRSQIEKMVKEITPQTKF
eukprot:TRINITY_DN6416_c0_g1_i1.p1 TRINITY_DN6416_c0_g1~~TRINITY_DN6416_c0_g1_i1.p1  ORF type:complete len:247 (+),score=46.38 TRINITY_DN6416_c0_g1_i1:67-807(+)